MPNPVLEHPPPRFDHAVGEYDVDLGYDALDRSGDNECIQISIEVRGSRFPSVKATMTPA
jgi:hypothetical protein